MTFTISAGYWLIPLIFTVGIFVYAYSTIKPSTASGYASIFDGLESVMKYAASLILSLIAWLIWALFR